MSCIKLRFVNAWLESRVMPAVFTVENLNDAGIGTLRQAVLDANTNIGADSIQFLPSLSGNQIFLTSGQMTISDELTIDGESAKYIGVNGNGNNRIFVSNASLTISYLSMDNGSATVAPAIGFGGVVHSTAALVMTDCFLNSGNASAGGGLLFQSGPTLTLLRCSFGGGAAGSQGGAVLASGTVSVATCTFQSNVATGNTSSGGAIHLTSGMLTMDNSGFQGDFATFGGAIRADGPVTIRNSTIANCGSNIFGAKGGGLYLTAGGTLWNCTVANNGVGNGTGGGIHGAVNLESTIVSNNGAPNGPDISGSATAKNCAIGNASGFAFTNGGGNLPFGTNVQFRFSLPGSYGGGVLTMPLLANSPCKDAGSNPAGLAFDERGEGYPRISGSAADMGAFEIQPPPKVTFQLNEVADSQRSRITHVLLTVEPGFFNVTGGMKGATQLKRVSDNANVTLAIGGKHPPSTQYAMYFSYNFSAGPLDGTSLADGVYTLTITSSKILDPSAQNLDGNGDGIGGDDYVSPTTPGDPNRIFRLFGDVDGDADVDTTDFIQFRLSFGGSNFAFDFDGDGAVAANDFIQFRLRFGSMI